MSKLVNRENLKAFRQKLDDKYVIEGEYSPETKVGYADESGSLTPYGDNSGANDTTPFVFQSTGGSSDVGSKAYLRALRGNSFAFNQLVENGNKKKSFTTSSVNSVLVQGNLSIPSGHTILLKWTQSTTLTSNVRNTPVLTVGGSAVYQSASTNNNLSKGDYYWLITLTGVLTKIDYWCNTPSSDVDQDNFQLIDLTLMFGAGNEPTSVVEFNRLFPKPYYSYNAGTLLSCKVNGIKNVGYNAFDGELEIGSISSNGSLTTDSYGLRSKNYTKVVAGQTYTVDTSDLSFNGSQAMYLCEYDNNNNFIKRTAKYSSSTQDFELTSNTHFIKLVFYGSSVNSSVPETHICFHLTWDGSKTGYEPYESKSYQLPNIELRGGFYDNGEHWGDELTPDGTHKVGTAKVKLKDLTFSKYTSGDKWLFYATVSGGRTSVGSNNPVGVKCNKYACLSYARGGYETANGNDKLANWDANNSQFLIKDLSYSDVTAFENSFTDDDYIIFELATPTETQDDNYKYQETQDVDDYGTQEFLYDNNIAIPVPQGNDFFYPVDYKAFIDSLGGREDIEYDASEIVSHSELSASETQRDTIDSQLKDAICGTLRQCLCVKASLDFNNTACVDLGTLTWYYDSESGHESMYTDIQSYIKPPASNDLKANILCSIYQTGTKTDTYTHSINYVIAIQNNGRIRVYASNMGTDATAFKNAMKGVLLAYEKA